MRTRKNYHAAITDLRQLEQKTDKHGEIVQLPHSRRTPKKGHALINNTPILEVIIKARDRNAKQRFDNQNKYASKYS
jgi:hypothetical protein